MLRFYVKFGYEICAACLFLDLKAVMIGTKNDLRAVSDYLLKSSVGKQTVFLGSTLYLVSQTEREKGLAGSYIRHALL